MLNVFKENLPYAFANLAFVVVFIPLFYLGISNADVVEKIVAGLILAYPVAYLVEKSTINLLVKKD